ncbi:hypothetical protein OEG84_11565 [Hoeflea sp. G2-23]|uniref:Uncharacterized protein n=1 Tax=Hoeflea algicola TaxID=2983763 RepID=A0ABT3Z967_9HYPH|nr:hypothetical protein [Hoeflea algicola]MCY0148331.1 hypothetical protein [Hoeflea algicola]
MTPLEIKILLACYCIPVPERDFERNNWHSPAAKEARERFYQAGVIRADTNQITDAGKNVIKRLCAVTLA